MKVPSSLMLGFFWVLSAAMDLNGHLLPDRRLELWRAARDQKPHSVSSLVEMMGLIPFF